MVTKKQSKQMSEWYWGNENLIGVKQTIVYPEKHFWEKSKPLEKDPRWVSNIVMEQAEQLKINWKHTMCIIYYISDQKLGHE